MIYKNYRSFFDEKSIFAVLLLAVFLDKGRKVPYNYKKTILL